MQTLVLTAMVAVLVGLIVGTVWGRKLEQQAVGAVLGEFHKLDAEARSVVNRLVARLPYVKKHL